MDGWMDDMIGWMNDWPDEAMRTMHAVRTGCFTSIVIAARAIAIVAAISGTTSSSI